jgi:hypothetical protein
MLNLILRGISGGGDTVHIVPFYGPLPADSEDNRYWGERDSYARCYPGCYPRLEIYSN